MFWPFFVGVWAYFNVQTNLAEYTVMSFLRVDMVFMLI